MLSSRHPGSEWGRGKVRRDRSGWPGGFRRAGRARCRGTGRVAITVVERAWWTAASGPGACWTGRAGGGQENSSRRSKKTRGPVVRPMASVRRPPRAPRPAHALPTDPDDAPVRARIPCSGPWRPGRRPDPPPASGPVTARSCLTVHLALIFPPSRSATPLATPPQCRPPAVPSRFGNLLPTSPSPRELPCSTPWHRHGNRPRPLPLTEHEPAPGGAHAGTSATVFVADPGRDQRAVRVAPW